MAKKYKITLTQQEREKLEAIVRTRSSKSPQVRRCYLLLAADEQGAKQWTDEQIGATYGSSISTIERLRQRFVESSFETALYGKKREPIAAKVLDGRVEAKRIALRCSNPPAGHQQWSLRLLAESMVSLEYVEHISHESVRQLLKKTRLSLGRSKAGGYPKRGQNLFMRWRRCWMCMNGLIMRPIRWSTWMSRRNS